METQIDKQTVVKNIIEWLCRLWISNYRLAQLFWLDKQRIYEWKNYPKYKRNPTALYYKMLKKIWHIAAEVVDEYSTKPDEQVSMNMIAKDIEKKFLRFKQQPTYYMMIETYIDNRFTRMEKTVDLPRLNIKKKKVEMAKCCELCWTTNVTLDAHHIIYRSEAKWHQHLHSDANIIILCRDCHRAMHKSKKIREVLVRRRGLKDLFPDIIKW